MNVKFYNSSGVTYTHLNNVVGHDALRPAMQGVYIDFKEKVLVGTDSSILAVYPIDVFENDTDLPGVIVPVALFNALRWMGSVSKKDKKYADEPEFVLSDAYAEVYYLGELMYRCKYIDAKYPNYASVLPKKENMCDIGSVTFPINRMKKLCAGLPFSDPFDYSFSFFGKNKAVLLESKKADYDGRGITAIIMPFYEG